MLSGKCLEALVPRIACFSTAAELLWNQHEQDEQFYTIDREQAKWLVNGREVGASELISDLLTGDVLVCQLVIRKLPGVPVGMVLKRVLDLGDSFWFAAWVACREQSLFTEDLFLSLRSAVVDYMERCPDALVDTWDGLHPSGNRTTPWWCYCRLTDTGYAVGPVQALALAQVTRLTVFVAIAQDNERIYAFRPHEPGAGAIAVRYA